ncbi:MAG: exodeoxyribonuclease VII large subunit [Thermoleophilaceae bacterium]|nr:exodeoxyribonuclease VII large subunit [Thermoleophilaceae bacterium]
MKPDPELPGPFPVGRYAAELREFMRARARVLVLGEVTGFKRSRVSCYFELRDRDGAIPCSIWNSDLDRLGIDELLLRDGAEVVAGGGPDYYPGSATAAPSFSFRATHLRLAGEGDLLAQLARLRATLESEGLFKPQRRLARPLIPKTIGVVTARGSAACADLLAGLERRGWRGTIIWADAPVQDRRAAPAIAEALRGLAALPRVEVAVVCRGGGSLFDLWAFCDEGLCRTVALLRLPVISAVGHESDHTLLDDVAALACSTPTHAAGEVVGVSIPDAGRELATAAALASNSGRSSVGRRGRRLIELAGVPARSVRAERSRMHQTLREVRASGLRGVRERRSLTGRHGLVMTRRITAERQRGVPARGELLAGLELALRAHEPERTLQRGYALVEDPRGEPIASAAAARRNANLTIRFADDAVKVRTEPDD